jgi:hypothetical protein
MCCRLLTTLVLIGSLALVRAASAQTAPPDSSTFRGEAPSDAANQPAADVSTTRQPGLAGFDALASLGYGSVTEVQQLEINPYAVAVGGDLGFTWDMGLRLGVAVSYGAGRTLPQTYSTRRRQFELTADSQSFSGMVSIGYDLWLRFLILRYSLGLGGTWMHWELADVEGTVDGYSAPNGSAVSFVFAPGLKVLWPFQPLACGIGFDYLFQADSQTPSGIVVQVLLGIKP